MATSTEVCKTSDLTEGTASKFEVQGHEILLAKVNNNYYAVDNRCTHLNGDLSEGELEGTVITCPRHYTQYDLKDGSIVRWLRGYGVLSKIGVALKRFHPLTTYKVTVDGDTIFVEI